MGGRVGGAQRGRRHLFGDKRAGEAAAVWLAAMGGGSCLVGSNGASWLAGWLAGKQLHSGATSWMLARPTPSTTGWPAAHSLVWGASPGVHHVKGVPAALAGGVGAHLGTGHAQPSLQGQGGRGGGAGGGGQAGVSRGGEEREQEGRLAKQVRRLVLLCIKLMQRKGGSPAQPRLAPFGPACILSAQPSPAGSGQRAAPHLVQHACERRQAAKAVE